MANRVAEPLYINRFFTGLITQRSPLMTPFSYAGLSLVSRHDALIDGLNMEVTNNHTLARRPGFPQYCSVRLGANETPLTYSHFRDLQGNVTPLLDTNQAVYSFTPTTLTSLFTKNTSAGQSHFLTVGNSLYFTDGVEQQKYINVNGSFTVQNWGIAMTIPPVGPNACGAGSDIAVASSSGSMFGSFFSGSGTPAWVSPGNITTEDGSFATSSLSPGFINTSATKFPTVASQAPGASNIAWGNINNIKAQDGLYASCDLLAGTGSMRLLALGFGFSIPANATILGIQAQIVRRKQSTGTVRDRLVSLMKGSAGVGVNKAGIGNWALVPQGANYGAVNDLWGTTWTPAEINSPGFGILIGANEVSGGSPATAQVDSFSITVSYSVPGTVKSDLLSGTTFGFALTAGTAIGGILVEVKGTQTGNPAGSSISVQLQKAGNPIGLAKTGLQLPAVNGFIALGGVSDLWGATWNYNDINQTNFGILIQGTNSATTTATWNIDFVRITIYGPGGPPVVTKVAGALTTTGTGYTWVYCYGNSNDGSVSSPTQQTARTTLSSQNAQIPVVASADPQVNQIRLFRTADGGAQFLEHPKSPFPNSNATITDSSPDSQLQNVVAPAPLTNNPPPVNGTVVAYYLQRVWIAAGNALYFSGGPDTVVGNGATAFPPANVFTFRGNIFKLVATSQGLLVFTSDTISVILGVDTLSFYPKTVMSNFGVITPNAVDSDGDQIYVYTTQSQLFTISPGTQTDTGFSIGDLLLENVPSGTMYLTAHRNGTDAGLFVSDGSTNVFFYSFNLNCWATAYQLAGSGGVGVVKSIETSPGTYSLMVGRSAPNGYILSRDINTFSDDAAFAYPCFATIGSIQLSPPGAELVPLCFVLGHFAATGSQPTISILFNEIANSPGAGFITLNTGVPEAPIGMAQSQTLTSLRWDTKDQIVIQ